MDQLEFGIFEENDPNLLTDVYPVKMTPGSAGFDLMSAEKRTIRIISNQIVTIATNLVIRLPEGTYGQIKSRSSLAVKYGIDVLAGVIDSDYRGMVKVVLINHGKAPVDIRPGERFSQLLVLPLAPVSGATWRDRDILLADKTQRGTGGFGSTNGVTLHVTRNGEYGDGIYSFEVTYRHGRAVRKSRLATDDESGDSILNHLVSLMDRETEAHGVTFPRVHLPAGMNAAKLCQMWDGEVVCGDN